MSVGSFSRSALAEIESEDVLRMLTLDETLFVEHKSGLDPGSRHGVMSADASFANGLGGWLLLGVTDGRPLEESPEWLSPTAPPLIDQVRDLLRTELDPLPSFEARKVEVPGTDRSLGVVRVYESSDTPHLSIRTGAVYVREVAGVRDVSDDGRPGPGRHGERVYAARQIGSRAQLVELAERGRSAAARVEALLDPLRPLPLVERGLGIHFEPTYAGGIQPTPATDPSIVVRLAPYTLPAHFRGWATTADCAAALLAGAEKLSGNRGLDGNWAEPDPSGVAAAIALDREVAHQDSRGFKLSATARLVVDAGGIVGAALRLGAPDEDGHRATIGLGALAEMVGSVVEVAATVLTAGETLGRVRCQIDLQRITTVFQLEQGPGRHARPWLPSSGDLLVPADAAGIEAVARAAANALGRSGGIPAWDDPGGHG